MLISKFSFARMNSIVNYFTDLSTYQIVFFKFIDSLFLLSNFY